MWKKCWVCKGKGHHLSKKQYNKLIAECKDKNKINWKKVDRLIKDGGMRCELCDGEKSIFYPTY